MKKIKKYEFGNILSLLVKRVHISTKEAALLIMSLIIISFISFFKPQIIKYLTDRGLVLKDYSIVLVCTVLLSICLLIEMLIEYYQTIRITKIENDSVKTLHTEAFKTIISCPHKYYQNYRLTQRELLSILKSEKEKTIILISHSDDVNLMDHIYNLEDGKLIKIK